MNELKIFENPAFGKVRVVERGGEPWFIGKDVAEILGYSNTPKAIRDHVDDEDELVSEVLRRRFFENEPMRRTQTELAISEDKYYRLRDIGIGYARECAIQLGLIKVF